MKLSFQLSWLKPKRNYVGVFTNENTGSVCTNIISETDNNNNKYMISKKKHIQTIKKKTFHWIIVKFPQYQVKREMLVVCFSAKRVQNLHLSSAKSSGPGSRRRCCICCCMRKLLNLRWNSTGAEAKAQECSSLAARPPGCPCSS